MDRKYTMESKERNDDDDDDEKWGKWDSDEAAI